MSNLSRETIKKAIDQYLFDAELQETYNRLNQALDYAVEARFDENSNFTQEDVETYIFSENDALDSGEVAEDTELWNDIRDIQHSIVAYFAS
ncbi:hypothetical protein P0E95_001984 [Vibrio metschnikovii]|nr:hypothetical protein [Vibrio metschnikovii]EKO3768545.1 hypothetical protein [Vibrio metschnikovii]